MTTVRTQISLVPGYRQEIGNNENLVKITVNLKGGGKRERLETLD